MKVLALELVSEIVPVPVPAVVVNPVGFALDQQFPPLPAHINVPPLNVIFLVPALVVTFAELVNVFPAKSNVPFVKVMSEFIPASAKVVVIPLPLMANDDIDLPVYVIVPVPTVVKSVDEYVPPDANVNP